MIQSVKAIWAHRYFWMSLVKLDLRNRYRRSVLGVGWSLLHPIAMTAVLCTVFSGLMGPANGGWKAYAPFLLCGMCIWDFLRNSMLAGATSLIQNEPYIRQMPLPYSIYPLRAVLGNVLHFMIGLGVVIGLIVILRQDISSLKAAAAALPGIVFAIFSAWGLATVLSYITVFFRDIKHVIEVGMQVAYFLTPIIYERSILDQRGLGFIVDLNPANTLIELIRLPLVHGQVPSLGLYIYGLVVTIVSILLAAGTAHWLRNRVIFHL